MLIAQETAALKSAAEQGRTELEEVRDRDFRATHTGYAGGTFYVVWNTAARPAFNSADVPVVGLRAAARAARTGPPRTQVLTMDGQEVLVVSERYRTWEGVAGVLQVGQGLGPVERVEQEAVLIVVLACLCVFGLGLGASAFLVRSALGPIRLAFEQQRQFTADASHELRTPLSVLDASVQLLARHPERTVWESRDLLDTVAAEVRRMGRLVASLLDLARADSGHAQIQRVDSDLDEIVQAAARSLEPVAASVDVRLGLWTAAGRAEVDPDRIRQLVVILLDNAIRHSPSGKAVEVRCTRSSRHLELEVADRGPGVPPPEREKVFERFYRLDRSEAGAGLGLAIARWIVSAHGGRIWLIDNHPGLKVIVRLPGGNGGCARRLLARLHPVRPWTEWVGGAPR
jgi:signal transduction histidine kinase